MPYKTGLTKGATQWLSRQSYVVVTPKGRILSSTEDQDEALERWEHLTAQGHIGLKIQISGHAKTASYFIVVDDEKVMGPFDTYQAAANALDGSAKAGGGLSGIDAYVSDADGNPIEDESAGYEQLSNTSKKKTADQGIFCNKCGGDGMVRGGGVVRNCPACKGTGISKKPRKKIDDEMGRDFLGDHEGAAPKVKNPGGDSLPHNPCKECGGELSIGEDGSYHHDTWTPETDFHDPKPMGGPGSHGGFPRGASRKKAADDGQTCKYCGASITSKGGSGGDGTTWAASSSGGAGFKDDDGAAPPWDAPAATDCPASPDGQHAPVTADNTGSMNMDISPQASRRRETQLLRAMSKATQAEQKKIMAELDKLRADRDRQAEAKKEWDFTASAVAAVNTPIQTWPGNHGGTDWLLEITSAKADSKLHQNVGAEASMWFTHLAHEVVADSDEFVAQAIGKARVVAGPYGPQRQVAEKTFLDHVAFLRSRVAGDVADWDDKATAPAGGPGNPQGPDPDSETGEAVSSYPVTDVLDEPFDTFPFKDRGPTGPGSRSSSANMMTEDGLDEIPDGPDYGAKAVDWVKNKVHPKKEGFLWEEGDEKPEEEDEDTLPAGKGNYPWDNEHERTPARRSKLVYQPTGADKTQPMVLKGQALRNRSYVKILGSLKHDTAKRFVVVSDGRNTQAVEKTSLFKVAGDGPGATNTGPHSGPGKDKSRVRQNIPVNEDEQAFPIDWDWDGEIHPVGEGNNVGRDAADVGNVRTPGEGGYPQPRGAKRSSVNPGNDFKCHADSNCDNKCYGDSKTCPQHGGAKKNAGRTGRDYDWEESDVDPNHEHTYGPWENARLTGNPHRKCTHPGCRVVSLDGDDDDWNEHEGRRVRAEDEGQVNPNVESWSEDSIADGDPDVVTPGTNEFAKDTDGTGYSFNPAPIGEKDDLTSQAFLWDMADDGEDGRTGGNGEEPYDQTENDNDVPEDPHEDLSAQYDSDRYRSGHRSQLRHWASDDDDDSDDSDSDSDSDDDDSDSKDDDSDQDSGSDDSGDSDDDDNDDSSGDQPPWLKKKDDDSKESRRLRADFPGPAKTDQDIDAINQSRSEPPQGDYMTDGELAKALDQISQQLGLTPAMAIKALRRQAEVTPGGTVTQDPYDNLSEEPAEGEIGGREPAPRTPSPAPYNGAEPYGRATAQFRSNVQRNLKERRKP